MANQYKNKIIYGNQTLMDITDTTASTEDVLEGQVFYSASGARSVGTLTDATQSTHGLMSATDKTTLDNLVLATEDDTVFILPSQITEATTSNSNASTIINAAINEAVASGKHYVLMPAGEYWLTATIYLQSNIILKGYGIDSTILKIADGCDIDAIRVSGPTSNAGLMDFTIDGNRIQNYSTFANGHHGNAINVWLHYGRIERIRTKWIYKHSLLLNYDVGSSDDGLNFESSHEYDQGNLNKVLWCDFTDSLLQGVMWGWRTMDSWMCYTNIGSHAANLYLEGGTSRFIGNHFDGDGDNGAGPEYNVYCGDGCNAMLFEGNIFENTQKENIYFRQPSYSNETKTISIVNNIIRTCSKTANNTYANIYISGYDASVNAKQIIISGNQIFNPDVNGNHGYAGIHLNYCKDVKISGNTFFNVGTDNVKLEDTCSNVIDDEHSSIRERATSSADGTRGLVPAPTSADIDKFLAGDGTYKSGGLPMVILSYGNSTWNDFITAYNNHVIVYCRASSNANPASGQQLRMAFMAYVAGSAETPTEVEFQYYRSVNSHSATQMGDQVFVYKLTNKSVWSVITREASIKQIKVDSNDPGTVSWSNNVVTLKSGLPKVSSSDNGKILKVVNGAWAAVSPE